MAAASSSRSCAPGLGGLAGFHERGERAVHGACLERLAEGLAAFREEVGDAWAGTTGVVVTEFGRMASPDGSRGTDHGTAGAGFVPGPRVARAAVVADSPGTGDAALFEGGDLRPTLDTRAAPKGVVAGTSDLTAAHADRVFPGSEGVRGRYELLR